MPDGIKGPSKAGETTLGLLGTLASITGKVLFGSDIDLGAPFFFGAQQLQQRRLEKSLRELLSATPSTQPIVQDLDMLSDSGGLMSNLNVLTQPEAPSRFGLGIPQLSLQQPPTSSILPGEIGGLPVSPPGGPQPASLLRSLVPQQAGPDLGSPEFLQRLAQVRPDLAEQVLTSRLSQRPQNLLEQIKDLQQISAFETPEQKREARFAERKALLEASGEIVSGRQREQKQLQLEDRIITRAQKPLQEVDEGIAAYNNLQEQYSSIIVPALAEAPLLANSSVQAIYQRTKRGPELALLQAGVNSLLQARLRAQEGARSSDQDRAFFRTIVPRTADTPQVFNAKITNQLSALRYNRYLMAFNAASAAKNPEIVSSFGFSPEQMQIFSELHRRINATPLKDMKKLHTDPVITQMRNYLGFPVEFLEGTK